MTSKEGSIHKYFLDQKKKVTIILLVMIFVVIGTSIITEFNMIDAFTSLPKVAGWVFSNFVPNEDALGEIPNIIDNLIDTALLAVMATVTAAVLSFLLAIMGSRTTKVSNAVMFIARGFSSICRNIPIAAWAMIFLISFGQSMVTGYIALFIATLGFLTRVFIETIDETSASSVEALHATGASYFQVILHSVVPASVPQLLSWMLYMIETNIRSATLVGMLTGTGIGNLFILYYRAREYRIAALIVTCLVLVVIGIEMLSNFIRRLVK